VTYARELERVLADAVLGARLPDDAALRLLADAPLEALLEPAERIAVAGHGRAVTYSRKVFVPLTRLCRDVCAYCTFADVPRNVEKPFLSPDDVLAIARDGERAGCREALFTLGDRPEARYAVARRALRELGHERTLDYLREVAERVVRETTLLPHLNPGLMSEADLAALRPHAASMGLMLESAADRLCEPGGPHWGSPDKAPRRRLAVIEAAGRLAIPFTTGLLIGIGETRRERIEALLALRALHERYGHLHDLIVQNFVPKADTRMAAHPAAALEEQLWTNAVARLLFGAEASIQAPPNLRDGDLEALLRSGINDWGGVSPVTPDHVNPESPWPAIVALEDRTRAADRVLLERLAIAPRHAREAERWAAPAIATRILRATDALGYVREDAWYAGAAQPLPAATRTWLDRPKPRTATRIAAPVRRALAAARAREPLGVEEIRALYAARGEDFAALVGTADELRRECVGDAVGYVVNRNINYTNVCTHRCTFCAFSKGRSSRDLRGPGYLLGLDEIAARVVEAWERGATEVCLQGGIHPTFTGRTYLDIVRAIKSAVPGMHVHAFSPLEVAHGARTLGRSLESFLVELRDAGLGSLPGTAAEILDDEARAVLCPDKLTTEQWLEVVATAHGIGLRTTATIMFGHVDMPEQWARHLLHVRELQRRTGGFTEFVPLPFVHMEAPLWRRGRARSGPTLREAVAMHAVARLVLAGHVDHVQASWVKLGLDGLALCLQAGADDMGGTLMNESITRAAGGAFGQGVEPAEFEALAARLGRSAWRRTTLYRPSGRPAPEPARESKTESTG
jgi:FO synthase